MLLAFIVVIAYQNYGDTQTNVSNEADAFAAIVRDSDAFQPPDRDRVRTAVGAYVRAVVNDEWPRMHEGKNSARAAAAVDGVYAAILGVDPKGSRAVTFYDDSVQQLSTALVARRNRLDDAGGGLPWVIGVLLIVGPVVIVGYTVLVGSRSFWFHAIGAAAIAVVSACHSSCSSTSPIRSPICCQLGAIPGRRTRTALPAALDVRCESAQDADTSPSSAARSFGWLPPRDSACARTTMTEAPTMSIDARARPARPSPAQDTYSPGRCWRRSRSLSRSGWPEPSAR